MNEELIKLNTQTQALQELKKPENKGLILLIGKSGSGKTSLLKSLQSQEANFFFQEPLFDEKALFQSLYKSAFKQSCELGFEDLSKFFINAKDKFVFLLDEVNMYEESLLEKIRLLSDIEGLCFVLSSHCELDIFTKEHFKSRVFKIIKLKELELSELSFYIQEKFQVKLKLKEVKWLLRLSKANLRILDKVLKSFLQISTFYEQNKQRKSIQSRLEMSALYHELSF